MEFFLLFFFNFLLQYRYFCQKEERRKIRPCKTCDLVYKYYIAAVHLKKQIKLIKSFAV